MKSLDTSLNNIRIVTGKSADEMANFAVQANNAAKELGKTTTDYTNAALIYAQQGLNDKEIEERTKITLKAANVTGQSTDAVSEQLTAVWNGYKVNADEAELYVDRLAAVAATTASDLKELSTGMSKVASAAAAMGVGEDQLAAQLSTIISVTKQAPESVGTALTI
ncbi:MAG: phage tail tape measure protein [Methanosphaera sp.]|nr:phage tail tape measure protein [Methanosphaera sp.]